MKTALGSIIALLVACSAGDEGGSTVTRPGAGGGVPLPEEMGRETAPSDNTPVVPGQFSPNTEVGNGGDENNCGLQYFNVDRRPADVLLVLDRSGSMREPPEGTATTTTKWDLTVPALLQIIQETDSAVSWGMKLFPEGEDNGECSAATINDAIHVPIAPLNAGAVISAITTTTPDGDGTPTGDAINAAVRYLSTSTTPNREFIVLATDGEPSCSPSGEGQEAARPYAVTAVTSAAAAGFPVFVVGVATTKDTATEALNAMALAGGASRSDPNPLATRYYLANTQAELVTALRAITGEIATCVFPLSTPPPVPNNIAVKVDGTLVVRDSTRVEGWEYTNAALNEIEVYGSWCDRIESAVAADVQVIYACEGVIIR